MERTGGSPGTRPRRPPRGRPHGRVDAARSARHLHLAQRAVEPGDRMKIAANYYQQFDADLRRSASGEGYGGWQRAEIEIGRAALVVMHAWEAGTPAQYPGWYRAVEYIPRSQAICREV